MTSFDKSLSGFSTVYCDSKVVLEQAWAAGLPRTARVLTSSPSLLVDKIGEPVQREFDAGRRAELNDSTLSFTQSIYEALKGDEQLEPFAILAARMGILFQPIVAKAASLQDDDFNEPRLILNSHVGHGPTDRLFQAPWSDLLANSKEAKSFTFPIPKDNLFSMRGGTPPGVMVRLKQAAWDKLAYRFHLKIGRYLPDALTRGRALVFSENELLVETAAWLGFSGFGIRALSYDDFQSSDVDAQVPAELEDTLRKVLIPVLRNHVRNWVIDQGVDVLVELFFEKVLAECMVYLRAEGYWSDRVERLAMGSKDVVLMNYPGGAMVFALIAQCRKRNVPVVAFEHGATRQFCATHTQMQAAFENNFVDWVMAFNTLSSEMSNANPFAKGRSLAVGFPKDYFSNIGRVSDLSKPPVLFVSTTLYVGNMQSLSGSLTDDLAAEREIGIVNGVLDKIPYRVAYKPYPSIRYPDPDPIHQAVHASKNIDFFSDGYDLRYEIRKYRVIVTSRGTSTVSWCVMSDKPLVFIDYGDHMPLTDAAREAFRKGVFLIETKNEGWQEELRTFLSKSIAEIEALWAEKAEDRRHLVRDFFTIPRPGGGKRAAEFIRQIMSSETVKSEAIS